MMANIRPPDWFKLTKHITTLLNEHEDDIEQKRKIVEKHNGNLFYIFGKKLPTEESNDR